MPSASLHLAPAAPPRVAGSDVALLAFLFALHALPVLAALAGRAWGAGTIGYATAVALVTGRELVREARSVRGGRG